ncbi:Hypothetical_protein [Hexamita inflata]|uniref:Hypothetical_protein n=1 Tax=Hexamita inflata TaxID=28002 RepID=A0ABP1J596_9EUKA
MNSASDYFSNFETAFALVMSKQQKQISKLQYDAVDIIQYIESLSYQEKKYLWSEMSTAMQITSKEISKFYNLQYFCMYLDDVYPKYDSSNEYETADNNFYNSPFASSYINNMEPVKHIVIKNVPKEGQVDCMQNQQLVDIIKKLWSQYFNYVPTVQMIKGSINSKSFQSFWTAVQRESQYTLLQIKKIVESIL